jgi:hypothetical protein
MNTGDWIRTTLFAIMALAVIVYFVRAAQNQKLVNQILKANTKPCGCNEKTEKADEVNN